MKKASIILAGGEVVAKNTGRAARSFLGWAGVAILGIAVAYVAGMSRMPAEHAGSISALAKSIGSGELLGKSMGAASPAMSYFGKMAFHALGGKASSLAWMGAIFYTMASLAIFALLRPVAGRNIAAVSAMVCYASSGLLVGHWWPASAAALLAAMFLSALAYRGEAEPGASAIVVAAGAAILAAKPSVGIPLTLVGAAWLAAPRSMLGRQSWKAGACLLFLAPFAALTLLAAARVEPSGYLAALLSDMGWRSWEGAAAVQSLARASSQANWREWTSLPGALGAWMRAWLAFGASALGMLAISAMAWASKKGPSFDFEFNEARSMWGLGLFGLAAGLCGALGGPDFPQASLPLIAAGCAILSFQHRMSKLQLRLSGALCLLVMAQCGWLGGAAGKAIPTALDGISELAAKAGEASAKAAKSTR